MSDIPCFIYNMIYDTRTSTHAHIDSRAHRLTRISLISVILSYSQLSMEPAQREPPWTTRARLQHDRKVTAMRAQVMRQSSRAIHATEIRATVNR